MRNVDTSICATAVPRVSLVTPLRLKIASSLRLMFDREGGRSRGRRNRRAYHAQISPADPFSDSVDLNLLRSTVGGRLRESRSRGYARCRLPGGHARTVALDVSACVFAGQIDKSPGPRHREPPISPATNPRREETRLNRARHTAHRQRRYARHV